MIVGDYRWGGSFGVSADFVARTHCSVAFVLREHIEVIDAFMSYKLFLDIFLFHRIYLHHAIIRSLMREMTNRQSLKSSNTFLSSVAFNVQKTVSNAALS